MITQFGSGGISLIFDKSTFQIFSRDELRLLHRYFWINVTPILVMEILGDLSKEKDGFESDSKGAEFASKLFGFNSSVNTFYVDLITAELQGQAIPFYKPLVDTAQPVEMSDGQIGMRIHPSDERQALDRWQEQQFHNWERELSKEWRANTKVPTLLAALKEKINASNPNSRNLNGQQEILAAFDAYVELKRDSNELLQLLIEQFSIPTEIAGGVFYRWETERTKGFNAFAPYSLYCLRASYFFQTCLQNELIGTRPTNILDMQYVYYLPFCRVFVSNDKFHDSVVPYLINKNQKYIKGGELKDDLKRIILMKKQLSGSDLKRIENEPPDSPDSVICRIWKDMLLNWIPGRDNVVTDDELRMADEMIRKMRQAMPIG